MNRFQDWEICSPSGKWEKVRGDVGGREEGEGGRKGEGRREGEEGGGREGGRGRRR